MKRRKHAKENLMWRRKHPDCAPPNKNATSTVWLYAGRAVNGIVFSVYTARPNRGHLNYATRLSYAIECREQMKRMVAARQRNVALFRGVSE